MKTRLSPAMRVRELRAGNSPYRGHVKMLRDSGWIEETSTGLFFWNYFGRRSEPIYQNTILPAD